MIVLTYLYNKMSLHFLTVRFPLSHNYLIDIDTHTPKYKWSETTIGAMELGLHSVNPVQLWYSNMVL